MLVRWFPVVAAFGLVALLAPACSSDAVGVEDCRAIEFARCEAAQGCGSALRVPPVDECEQFYRDQCLHGLAIPSRPGAPLLDACVAAIEAAGDCVDGRGASTPVEECPGVSGAGLDVCEFLAAPERSPACDFLNEEPPPEDNDDDGSAGAAGSGN